MASYTQDNRPIRVKTALAKDAVLITKLTGTEGISQLFQYSLELIAPIKAPVDFADVLGQPAVVELDTQKKTRYFHGYINRFAQGRRDNDFIYYRAELVPQLWFWTQRSRSRIFQHVSVPEILKTVLDGLKVDFELKGTFEKRDYCVQYRESDFAFASRLMEEEGIYYFFKHAKGEHRLVVANTPGSHPDMPIANKLIYDDSAGSRDEGRIRSWEKVQEVHTGKVTLFDHCFEFPHKHLDADKTVPDTVQAGTVTHKLKVGGADRLELYDYPGIYAQRFDGIDRGGSPQAAEVQKIFDDAKRTVSIRLQEETATTLQIVGSGDCAQLSSGFKFTLERHFDGNDDYLLTQVRHNADIGDNYRSESAGSGLKYENKFTCIPLATPFRPRRATPRPTVKGSQTAVVVGPTGEEIFTDKYGRVKVQFHWDREGKNNADSSCWIRVATMWAGRNWGMIHIPRIGQEVVVDFLEGDMDQPIIVGSVYNADMMPPWGLPGNKTQSGIQTRSSPGGAGANFNQIRFEDKKGSEQVHIHAEKNQDIEVENDESHWVGHDRKKNIDHDETVHVKHDRTETVDNNETITIGNNRVEKVGVNETIKIGSNRTESVGANESIAVTGSRTRTVGGSETITVTAARTHTVGINEAITVGAAQEVTVGAMRTVTVGAAQSITVGAAQSISVGGSQTLSVGGGHTETIGKSHTQKVGAKRSSDVAEDDLLKVGKKLMIEAGEAIVLKTGDASIELKSDGTIVIKGMDITVEGKGEINHKASKNINMKGQKILQN
jgi:type VI secretion system secreted protein VgrG